MFAGFGQFQNLLGIDPTQLHLCMKLRIEGLSYVIQPFDNHFMQSHHEIMLKVFVHNIY